MIGLYQTQKLLHSKRDNQHNENISYRMGEKFFKSHTEWGIDIKTIDAFCQKSILSKVMKISENLIITRKVIVWRNNFLYDEIFTIIDLDSNLALHLIATATFTDYYHYPTVHLSLSFSLSF